MDASPEGESLAGNKRHILKSSSELDEVLSEDKLEDVKKEEDSSVQKRSDTLHVTDSFQCNVFSCVDCWVYICLNFIEACLHFCILHVRSMDKFVKFRFNA